MSNVSWSRTLQVNLLRALGAGLVWFVVALATGKSNDALMMLIMPAILIPIGLIAIPLARAGVPFIGITNLLAAILIIPGDLFVFIIKQIFPGLVPVRHYNPINLMLIVLVPESNYG